MWNSKYSNREYTDEELARAFLDGEEEAQNLLYSFLLKKCHEWWPWIQDNPDDDENQITELLVSKLSYFIQKWLLKFENERAIPLLGYIKRSLKNRLIDFKKKLKKRRKYEKKYHDGDGNSKASNRNTCDDYEEKDFYNNNEDGIGDEVEDDVEYETVFGNVEQFEVFGYVYNSKYSPFSLFPVENETLLSLGLTYVLNVGAFRLLYEKWPITAREGVPDSLDDFLDWIDWSNEKWDLPIKGEHSCTARSRLSEAFEELKAYCQQHVTNETFTDLKVPDGDWFSQALHISRDAYYKHIQRIKQRIDELADARHVE